MDEATLAMQQPLVLDEEALKDTAAFTRNYARKLRTWRKWVSGCWLVLFIVGCFFAPAFLNACILKFDPPPGTPGDLAQSKFQSQFPDASHESDTIVLINSADGRTPILDHRVQVEQFVKEVATAVVDWGKEEANPVTDFMVIHYFELEMLQARSYANMLLDNSSHPYSATAMIMTLHIKSGLEQGSMEGQRFVSWLYNKLDELNDKHLKDLNFETRATGMLPFIRDLQVGMEEDMLHMDLLSFPLALAVLAYMLRSVRLLIIPVMSMLLCIVTSFMVMLPVAKATTVIAIAPSTMMSVCVAFSIDYALFLLSTFRREIMRGASEFDAVVIMLDTSGHTICVSGLTIALCWFGIMFFPVQLLSTVGLGAGLAVVIAVAVNVTLTPALLLTFGRFFTNFDNFGLDGCGVTCSSYCNRCRGGNNEEVYAEDQAQRNEDNTSAQPPSSTSSSRNGQFRQEQATLMPRESTASSVLMFSPDMNSIRSPLSRFMTPATPDNMLSPSLNPDGTIAGSIASPVFGMVDPAAEIKWMERESSLYRCGLIFYGTKLRALASVVTVTALILPLTPWALDFHHSEDFKLFTPMDSIAAETALNMEDLYGGGRLAPYEILIEPPEGDMVLSNTFYHHIQEVLSTVVLNLDYGKNKPIALHKEQISAPMMFGGVNISFTPSLKDELSIIGCGVEDLGYILSICAAGRCHDTLNKCLMEQTCGKEIRCLEECRPTDAVCLTECLKYASFGDPTTREFAGCFLDECVLHPFTPSNQHNTTDLLDHPLHHNDIGDDVDKKNLPDCPSITLQFAQSILGKTLVPKSTWVMMNLQIDPFSLDGTQWLDKLRVALDEQSEKDGYKYYINGGDVPGHDTVNTVFDLFPRVMSILGGTILAILGITYRSVAIPATAIFTIALTLILVYSLGVLVYERGLLEWMHVRAFLNPIGHSLVWIVPSISAVISSGLSTDYTVFGVDGVHHYRLVGFNTKDSILCGNGQTGAIITAAGIIMTFAFGGLFLSSNAALNQLAFFLVISVLVDTFVVRTIIMPACMRLLGEANWWPMKPATLQY